MSRTESIKQIQVGGSAKDLEAKYYTVDSNNNASIKDKFQNVDTRIDNIEGRGRFLSTWNATTGKPGDLPSTIATTAYTYKTGDYYIVNVEGKTSTTSRKPNVPADNTIPAGTTLATWTYYENAGVDLAVNDTIYFTGTAWSILHTPVTQTVWGGIGGTLSNQTDLQSALDNKAGTSTATTSADGLMSSTDKTKLDAIVEAGTVGSATKGIYLNSGVPTAMTYELNATIPALGTAKQVLRVNSGATGLEYASVDSTPTSGSTNLINSGAVYSAIVSTINSNY